MTMTVKISGNEKHLSYARGVPGRRGGGKVGVDPEPGDPRSIFPLKLPWKVLHHRWQKQLTAWLVNVLVLIVVLAWLYLFSPGPLSLYTCIPSLCLCLWLMCTPESSQDAHRCRISGFGQKQQAAGSPRTWRPGSGTLTPGCLLHRLGTDRYIPINQSTFVALVLGLPTATEVWKISRSLGGFRRKCPPRWAVGSVIVLCVLESRDPPGVGNFFTALCEYLTIFCIPMPLSLPNIPFSYFSRVRMWLTVMLLDSLKYYVLI